MSAKRVYCDNGYLPRYCGAWLEGLATTLPDPARTLEIGTGTGCSLIATLLGLAHHEDVKCWTVDIRVREHLEAEMKKREFNRSRWDFINADSLDVAKTWNVPLNMIYIDGDHTYDGCYNDIMAWEPHLVFGGLMIFDDYDHGYWSVTEAVDDIMFAEDSTWRYCGQVGRVIAFEKGTLYERAPWISDYMEQYPSYARSRQTDDIDPWLCWGWGVLGHADPHPRIMRAYGKSPKPSFEDVLP